MQLLIMCFLEKINDKSIFTREKLHQASHYSIIRGITAHFDENMMGTIDILSKQETVFAAHIQTIKLLLCKHIKTGFRSIYPNYKP